MVNLVSRFHLCLGLLLTCQVGYASSGLEVKLSADRIELGKPVWLQISSASTSPSLHLIDLGNLQQDFHIDKPVEADDLPDSMRQSWKWRLYSYDTGKKSVPELHFDGLRSKPLQLTVTPAIDDKTGTEISLASTVSEKQPWMRQQVLFSYRAKTKMSRAQFRIGSPNNGNFLVESLLTEQTSAGSGKDQLHYYQLGWAFFPIKQGKQTVILPPLELVRDGVMTHRFYHQPLRLDVKPLPAYLPATIPVGRIELNITRPYRLFLQDNLENIQLSVIGSNTLATSLPDIRNQLTSNADLRIYPDSPTSKQTISDGGIVSRIDYRIPVKAPVQGLTTTGEIRTSYFDPKTGTLETSQYSGFTIFVINKWLAWLLIIFLITFLVYLVIRLGRKLVVYIQKLYGYRKSIKILISSNEVFELRKALACVARAEGQPQNMTLLAWYKAVIKIPRENDQDILNLANELLYKTKDQAAFSRVKQGMIKLLRQNAPWPVLIG
jgi:hypothetical protein